MSVTISVTFDKFPQIAAALPARTSQVVRKAALDIEAQAKNRAPVDTGTLKNSIQMNMEPMALEAEVAAGNESSPYGKQRKDGSISRSVTPSVEYAIYVEFGNQPFLTPAAEAVRPAFIGAMKQMLQEIT